MQLQYSVYVLLTVSDQRAHEKYGSVDPYTVARAAEADINAKAGELARDLASDDLAITAVTAQVRPIYG